MPQQLTPLEAQARLQASTHTVYLDVRSTPEFLAGHPPGAYHIPLLEVDPATGTMLPNPHFIAQVAAAFAPDTPIIAGCRSGGRSQQAAVLLENAGFTNLTNMQGGYGGQPDPNGGFVVEGWVACGLPVEQEAQPGRDFESLRQRDAVI